MHKSNKDISRRCLIDAAAWLCYASSGFSLIPSAMPQTTAAISGEAEVLLRISEQPLRSALNYFAVQSGFQLVYRTEDVSATLTAPSIDGRYLPDVALEKLLGHSGLKFYRINDRTICIRVAPKPTRAPLIPQHPNAR